MVRSGRRSAVRAAVPADHHDADTAHRIGVTDIGAEDSGVVDRILKVDRQQRGISGGTRSARV